MTHSIMHVILMIFKIISFLIGLYIALLSYRSYVKKPDTSILYLGIGFAIISFAVIIEGIIYEVLLQSLVTAHTIQSIMFTVGMVFIYISLRSK